MKMDAVDSIHINILLLNKVYKKDNQIKENNQVSSQFAIEEQLHQMKQLICSFTHTHYMIIQYTHTHSSHSYIRKTTNAVAINEFKQ